jgi:hypothetical protein
MSKDRAFHNAIFRDVIGFRFMTISFLLIGLLTEAPLAYGQKRSQKKVALVSFFLAKELTESQDDLMFMPLADRDLVNIAYQRFMTDVSKDFPFELLDHKVVVNNPEYRKFKSFLLGDTTGGVNTLPFWVADGFVFAFSEGTSWMLQKPDRDQCKLLDIFSQADGVMLVDMEYDVNIPLPRRTIQQAARLMMKISLYNRNCEMVFLSARMVVARGTFTRSIWDVDVDQEALRLMLTTAIDKLFEDFSRNMKVMTRKSAKRL